VAWGLRHQRSCLYTSCYFHYLYILIFTTYYLVIRTPLDYLFDDLKERRINVTIRKQKIVNFINSEKAAKIWSIFQLFWHYLLASNYKWKMDQIFSAFREYLNFKEKATYNLKLYARLLKVSWFRKQTFLFSFEPKTKRFFFGFLP
jgi:hypothetical protein